jgi:hypothetical protein
VSLQSETETSALPPGDWVNIVHPETGGTHTCLREAFDEVFSENGWVLVLGPDDEEAEQNLVLGDTDVQPEADDASETEPDEG